MARVDRRRRAATLRRLAVAEEEAVDLQCEGSQYQNSGIERRERQAESTLMFSLVSHVQSLINSSLLDADGKSPDSDEN